MRPYSLDLRERIVVAVTAGQSHSEVAERFTVSASTVSRYVTHSKERESLVAKSPPGAKTKIPEAALSALLVRLAQMPDATLAEHHLWLAEAHQVTVSLATVHRTIRRMGFTYKKSPSSPTNATRRSERSGVRRLREWHSIASSSLTNRPATSD